MTVVTLVASLIAPDALVASTSNYRGGPPTVWTVYAASRVALAYVEVEFDQQLYTADVERDVAKYRGEYAAANVRVAWVRPLSRITELTVSRSVVFADTGRLNVAASVRFAGVDEPLVLPDQCVMINDQQWERADELLGIIRDGVGASRQ